MKTAVPCYYHLEVDLTPQRVRQVRRILAAHLRHWDLGVLVEPVSHCASVLLQAIETHATDKHTVVEMWWTGQHLITAVSDNERDLRHPHCGPEGYLAQIAALSDGWGNYPATNGKIIWFSHRARSADGALLTPAPPAPTLRAAASPIGHAEQRDELCPTLGKRPAASDPLPQAVPVG
ncbi:pep a2 [Streptomyces sp. NPDC050844]|uniref:pep a2 n=1 Tax=Streptomyces sp. NPDC050844 TaxID=3155790 RepID=UPI0033C42DF9